MNDGFNMKLVCIVKKCEYNNNGNCQSIHSYIKCFRIDENKSRAEYIIREYFKDKSVDKIKSVF